MTYESNRPIEDESKLASVFNLILRKSNLQRLISTPRYFEDMKSDYLAESLYMFCLSILHEQWLHGVIHKLREWQSTINDYLFEYDGNWRYYACSKRLEMIREFGAEDSDFDDKGELITDNPSNEMLRWHTVAKGLITEGRDIVQDTKPHDLCGLATFLELRAQTNLTDFFKTTGHPEIHLYRQEEGENGEMEMVQMSDEDIVLQKALDSVEGNDLFLVVQKVCKAMNVLCDVIGGLNPFSDNKDILCEIGKDIQCLLDGRLDEMTITKREKP